VEPDWLLIYDVDKEQQFPAQEHIPICFDKKRPHCVVIAHNAGILFSFLYFA